MVIELSITIVIPCELCFQHGMCHSAKSKITGNVTYIWIREFDFKHHTLGIRNIYKNLVREYWTLPTRHG